MTPVQRVFLQDHDTIKFSFEQNKEDFIVDEKFEKPFSGKGNYLIVLVKKVNLTTWEMIEKVAAFLNLPSSQIGYAGLKDKYATTTQYISLPLKYEKQLKKFSDSRIEILQTFRHNEKINIGDLSGNSFTITLRDVDDVKAGRIEKFARALEKKGFPNYFGYQRFSDDSLEQAQKLIDGELFIKDSKLEKFLFSVYQSHLFNQWLHERVMLSKSSKAAEFLLLDGDVMMDEKAKLSTPKKAAQKEFLEGKLLPTGLLPGRGVFRARDAARKIEEKYDDMHLSVKGYRRPAWVYPKHLTCKYVQKESLMRVEFTLPKASYATVLIENIANKKF